MAHVVRMTLTGATGITFVFLVDLANLFWLAKSGDSQAVAAIGFAFAIQFFSVSSGIGLMIATTAIVSRRLGMGERGRARQDGTAALIISGIFQALVAAIIVGFRTPLLEMVGAQGETLQMAARYLAITVPSLTVMVIGMTCTAVLRAEGDGKRSMYVTLTSGSISMIIDPLLIIYLELGLDGAAIALVISRCVLAIMGLRFAIFTHDLLARPEVWVIRRAIRPFFAVALPAMLTQLSPPFGNYLLTGVIAGFGDNAVAAWAVVNRLTVVCFGGIFSLSGAIGGIFGQNLGAKQYDRLRSTFRDALVFCICYTLVAWGLLMLTADQVIAGFDLQGVGVSVYRAFALWGAGTFTLVGALFVSNAVFNNLGKPARSTVVNWLRDGLLILPAAWIGAAWFAAPGVIYAQALIGAIVGVMAALWSWHFLCGFGGQNPAASAEKPTGELS